MIPAKKVSPGPFHVNCGADRVRDSGSTGQRLLRTGLGTRPVEDSKRRAIDLIATDHVEGPV